MTALLLWLTAGYPVISQQVQLPTRSDIVQGLERQLAVTLVAAEGDIFDVENAAFISHPRLTTAYIPLHPMSRSWDLLMSLLVDKEQVGPVSIGSLYLENDFPGLPELKAGLYTLKITNDLKLIAVDPLGNEIVVGVVGCQCTVELLEVAERSVRVHQAAVIDEGNPFFLYIAVALVIAGAGAVAGSCTKNECNCSCKAECGGD
jgi:hypothetical protein